jgi:hypothetical protein
MYQVAAKCYYWLVDRVERPRTTSSPTYLPCERGQVDATGRGMIFASNQNEIVRMRHLSGMQYRESPKSVMVPMV